LEHEEEPSGISQDVGLELSVGHLLQNALRSLLRIQGVQLAGCSYLDIRTPDDLRNAVYDKKFLEASKGVH
jgi:hypothetical protein